MFRLQSEKMVFGRYILPLVVAIIVTLCVSNVFAFSDASAQIFDYVWVGLDAPDNGFFLQNGKYYLREDGKYFLDCQEGLGNYLQIIDDGTGDNNILVCSTQGTTVPSTVQRSELRIIHTQDYNTPYFSRFSMKLPTGPRSRATIFWQVHAGHYDPPLSLAMEGYGNYMIKRSITDNYRTVLFRDYMPQGSWHKYFIEYQMGTNNNGRWRYWMDFEKKMEFEGTTAFDDPNSMAAPIFTKFGIYRYSDPRDYTSYFDDAGWSKNTSDYIWDADQMTEVIPANGLIGQWMFDEPNNYDGSLTFTSLNSYSPVAWDSSGGCSYVGNVRNGTTRTKGYVGRAILLDGIDDYVSIPDSGIWDTGSAVTISCRFKTTEQQTGKCLVVHDSSNYKYMLYLTNNSGELKLYIRTATGTVSVTASDNYADGVWHHIAGVYDRYAGDGNRLKLYVDGNLADWKAGYNENILAGDEGIYIGRWGSNYFKGTIDEARIYNYGLNAEEIAEEVSRKCIASWNFDNGSGGVAKDHFRSDNALTLSSSAGWTTGITGTALLCDGVDDYAQTYAQYQSYAQMWDAGSAVTASCRFKTAVQQNSKGLIVCDKSNYKYLLYLTNNSGSIRFDVRTTSGISSASVSKAAGYYADNDWHHAVGVYDRYASDGKRLKLYVDGNLAGYSNGYDADILNSDEGIAVGVCSTNYFNGAIDDVSIYKAGLSEAEVMDIYDLCLFVISGDINHDCRIDFEDMLLLFDKWLLDCTYPNNLTNPVCH